MDRSNSVPRTGSARLLPQSQPPSQRGTAAPRQLSNSQMKFMNDLVQQQPPSQRQAVNQQLEQLTPEEIREIQRKLESGEILHGLSQLPEGANMTHKFIVKVRKHDQQPQPVIRQTPPPPPQPQQPKYVSQYCPDCLNYEQKLKQQDIRIEQLLVEMNRMSQFLVDKSNEIEIWKQQYLAIQQELSKPKVIDNSDKYLKEINDLKNQLNQKDYENQMHETTIKQLQENQDQDIELRGGNNEIDVDQFQKDLEDARQDIELYKQDNDRLSNKVETLQAELRNRKTETKIVYRSDPDTENQLQELQQRYTLLQSQYYTLSEKSKVIQREVQYETKTVYESDPETERQLRELQNKYNLLQSQYYTLQETSSIVQKEIQYETKVVYQPDPETERLLQRKIQQLDELNSKYSSLQSQFQIIQEKQRTTVYETKTVYQPDPETERQLKIKISQLDELNSRYLSLQSQYLYLEEKSRTTVYETKTVYQPDPETERQLKIKISQLDELNSRYLSLQSQYSYLEEKSRTTVYETKTVYQPDPETERQLKMKTQQLDELNIRYQSLQQQFSFLQEKQRTTVYETKTVYQPDPETERQLKIMTNKCQLLQEQIEQSQVQIQSFQTKIYQFETRRSDSENYLIQIEQLKEQLRRSNAEIEQYTRKIYQFESNNEQVNLLKKQLSELRVKYEQEQTFSFQLKRRIEESKQEQTSVETFQYKIKELEQLLTQREERIRALTLEVDQYRSEVTTYQSRIQSIQINVENSADLRNQVQVWREKYEQLELRQRSMISDEINLWRTKYEQMEQRYVSLQQSYETIQITLNEYKDNEQTEVLKVEIKRLQKTIIDLRSEIDRLLVQSSDNQWLSKRYEEQQILIEQYKAQLEQRSSVSKEYTYEIVNPKQEYIMNSQILKSSTVQQFNKDSQQIYPTIQSSTKQLETREYSSVQPRVSYQQTQFLQPVQTTVTELKKVNVLQQYQSKAEQEFSSQRWNNNYQTVVEEVTRIDKRFG